MSRAVNSVTKSLDYELAMKTVGSFMTEYMRAGDFMKMQIEELEAMKEGADNPEKMHIMDLQKDRITLLVQLIGQGKIVMALKALRDGQIQLSPNQKPA